MRLDSLFRQLDARGVPPLDQWDPAFCGDMDLLITAGGEWIHEGAPIRRPELVRLLASVLRRESDGDYYLVTPAETRSAPSARYASASVTGIPGSEHSTSGCPTAACC